jgi:hypothetical protein
MTRPPPPLPAMKKRWRTLVQMGMSRATGYYLRSGRGTATTGLMGLMELDPETTNKNESITDLGDRAVLAIDGA